MTNYPIVLGGNRVAAERAPHNAARAAQITTLRGRAPRLCLVAFGGETGQASHLAAKQRACAAAGVEARTLILEVGSSGDVAADRMRAQLEQDQPDALFLQFPFPPELDETRLIEAIPEALDVDIMGARRIEQFMRGAAPFPPVTVSAGLQLLEAYQIDIQALRGVVVGEGNPFCLMFREALTRRGANMEPLVAPDAPDLRSRVSDAQLVVVAAARPGLLSSADLTAGTVALDVGYYNPGARGDIDAASGIAHLHSFAPVPGGIGPVTISALIERVIEFASTGRAAAGPDQT